MSIDSMSVSAPPRPGIDIGRDLLPLGHRFDLARLLAPQSVDTFVTNYLERQPLVRRGSADHHHDLFRFDEVEQAIAAAPAREQSTEEGVFGIRMQNGTFTRYSFEADSAFGRSNTALHRAFDEGYTVVANALRNHHAGVAHLCMSMEAALQQRVLCNLYLTPPSSQGFWAHADDHDTYLVQVAGRKHWSIWEPTVELPVSATSPTEPPPNRALHTVVELTAGDMLYLPCGWWHSGVTDASDLSVHLTFGSFALSWADLLVAVIEQWTEDDARLREAIPTHSLPADLDAMSTELWQHAVTLLGDRPRGPEGKRAAVAALRRRLVDRIEQHPAPFDSRLTETMNRGALGPDSPVEHRPGLRPMTVDDADGCRIVFVGGFLRGGPAARDAFTFAADTRRFCARDLPGLDPGVQVELVRELVLHGMVRPC